MKWFAKVLGDAMLAGAELDHIKTLFLTACAQAGNAEEMAVFIRHESEGRLHCEVMAYFSPAAHSVAQAVGARPCARPSPHGLGLLAGDEACWPLLFPQRPAG